MRCPPLIRGPLGRQLTFALTLAIGLGVGFELLHPGHHVHGDGDSRLHHHHFFLGEHSHAAPSADWVTGHGSAEHHGSAHAHDSAGLQPDQHDPEPGRGEPSSLPSLLIEEMASQAADFDHVLRAATDRAAERLSPRFAPPPQSTARRAVTARGPPLDSFTQNTA